MLDDKRVGGPVALGEDRIVIVHALEHRKPAPKPLASVREEIVKAMREEFGRTASEKAAEDARTKLAGGATFDEVAKELGVAAEPPRFIGRDDPSVPAPVRTAAFDSAKPAIGKSLFRTARLENGGSVVLGISGVRLDPTPVLTSKWRSSVKRWAAKGRAMPSLTSKSCGVPRTSARIPKRSSSAGGAAWPKVRIAPTAFSRARLR